MSTNELYYQASNRLLERSATIRPIPRKQAGTGAAFRKHHTAVLDVALDLQGVVDAAMSIVGDPVYAKAMAALAADVAKLKAEALHRVALFAPSQEGQ